MRYPGNRGPLWHCLTVHQIRLLDRASANVRPPLRTCRCSRVREIFSIALMGPGRYSEWRAVAPLLERRGFPTLDGLMGGASRVLPAAQRARTPKEIN